MSEQTLAEKTRKTGKIDPRLLVIEEGFNVRNQTPEFWDKIDELAASIREVGVKVPVRVRFNDKDQPIIREGHRRYLASMKNIEAGIELASIPCITEPKGTSEADTTLNLLVCNDGVPLTPLEQSIVVVRLVNYGWAESEIAKKWGKSLQHVNSLLALAEAPEAIKTLVRSGEVAASFALQQLKEKGIEAEKTLTQAVSTAQANGKKRATARHLEPSAKTTFSASESKTAIAVFREIYHNISTKEKEARQAIENLFESCGLEL